ncbi:MAG: DUF3363 domain-containing protein [Betaproteobacteria bacterium]|nr:DUF3363 domain-containing protein [Betaproteobacteria bacterium]
MADRADPTGELGCGLRRFFRSLRRAGIVERLDAERWRIPDDFESRARDYDTGRTRQLGARVLSLVDLDAQVTVSAATWLDRELIADAPVPLRDGGFGREARNALARRRQWLIAEGLAREDGGKIIYRCHRRSDSRVNWSG